MHRFALQQIFYSDISQFTRPKASLRYIPMKKELALVSSMLVTLVACLTALTYGYYEDRLVRMSHPCGVVELNGELVKVEPLVWCERVKVTSFQTGSVYQINEGGGNMTGKLLHVKVSGDGTHSRQLASVEERQLFAQYVIPDPTLRKL